MNELLNLLDEMDSECQKSSAVDSRWLQLHVARVRDESERLRREFLRKSKALDEADARLRDQRILHQTIVRRLDELHREELADLRDLVAHYIDEVAAAGEQQMKE